MYNQDKDTGIASAQLKERLVPFEVKIVANATPALLKASSELPGCAILRMEGQTAAADAIDPTVAASVTAPVNATGIFAILLDSAQTEVIKRVVKAEVIDRAGGAVAVTYGLTANGMMYINIDSAVNLATTNATFEVILHYLKQN